MLADARFEVRFALLAEDHIVRLLAASLLVLLVFGSACSSPPSEASDSGTVIPEEDGGASDSGTVENDAGTEDAGVEDAGTADAGVPDADGDTLSDEQEGRAAAVDTDSDGTPDYLDLDSDGDSLPDADEAGDSDLTTAATDYDADQLPDFRDTDSDGDCRTDGVEGTGDVDNDGHPNFRDRDSDDDGLTDGTEDADCDGQQDATESSAVDADTDNDGANDLVEVSLGTDPTSATDNPAANGDIAVLVSPTATDARIAFSSSLKSLDLYVLMDRSGSMTTELTSLKNNLATALNSLRCPPLGNGSAPDCIPDLWAGAGTIGYTGSGGAAYTNVVDLQPNPNFSGIPTTEPTGGTLEPLTFGLWASITGSGTAAATGCTFSNTVSARTSCASSQAATAGYSTFGYPCFRSGALPVLVLVTDEAPISAGDTYKCPTWTTTQSALLTHAARALGVYGSGAATSVISDMNVIATGTGAVNASAGNAPVVVDGSDANAAAAVQTAVSTLKNGVPLNLSVVLQDDPSDTVDAVSSFVDHLATAQLGTSECANGLTEIDTNADTFNDALTSVRVGTPVCWNLTPKLASTVAQTDKAQVFKLTAELYGDAVTHLDAREIWFIVPPLPAD